ncbi:MAG TPA: hypothetical protein DEA22_04265 [Blastocatellia bacterium]|nr:hypothetical protein [Blastocatellia bacterium]
MKEAIRKYLDGQSIAAISRETGDAESASHRRKPEFVRTEDGEVDREKLERGQLPYLTDVQFRIYALAAVVLAVSLSSLAACTSRISETLDPKNTFVNNNQMITPVPGVDDLEKLVREMGIAPDDTVVKTLLGKPRNELIENLSLLEAKRTDDKFITLNIAYLFCLVNHEYVDNRRIIVDELHSSTPTLPEDAIAMVGSLIKRGDTDLLLAVFVVSENSDGAVSEEISAIYIESAASQGEAFVKNLISANSTARVDVINRLAKDSSADEKTLIRNSMMELRSNPQFERTVKTILSRIESGTGN